MLARYVVIAVYGLKHIFNKEPVFLLFDLEKNTVVGYFFSEEDAFGMLDKLNTKETNKGTKTINPHKKIKTIAEINNGKITINDPNINTTHAKSLADYLNSITPKNDEGGKNKSRNKPR
ncbi:hypothetical protein F6Q07_00525 [Pectobacterium parmentieri]|uniref:hypothetical protein n=1 Tax=Pectobacterium parmentieri TaxID=1905730 RepID=UPI000EB22251|nr:hypothetical protein [Pectobacterium parmentieri]AYH01136.1 hypothetical protein C5E26_09440 [Pectobacterium parmentieri]AYH27407.1 hypothetical protein C5E20_09845 [Pectobacterium parmentieri]AYH31712.1 hypothetical protein C5E19_08875 [Pectobacterium parmentieri]MBI0516633.1 hypothetical protein [Pectobacterium parmentieri]